MPRRTITPDEFDYLRTVGLGERLRFFRKEIGKLHTSKAFTTTAMSERVGVSHQTIISIERGDSKKPAYQLIYKITQDLGIPFDALTDEFYQGEVRLIPIGEPIETATEISDEVPLSYIGSIVYQIFTDGMMRLIHDFQSSRPLDKEEFITTLGRIIGEYESCKNPDELFQQPHPMVKAATLFNEMDKHPKAFPVFPRSVWNDHQNSLIKKFEKKGED
ncbi:helix-turn-helix transcriptional regulator [Brevibacillus thermoruber]|uniref:Helix-turn-helix transcriptional regulator n=1 Tax=Brevibacillus thermoruber TaxID=33942 RepID=A0A9X3Z494_9BACL|nr:helix-turn-helix transcriptional regulator [Brevibacillus thermoruber]MDA5109474.1 helix-turn-helix transcriptional regulator [Brevibacillus thermoruber]